MNNFGFFANFVAVRIFPNFPLLLETAEPATVVNSSDALMNGEI